MAQEIADSKLIDTWSSDGLKVKPDISKIIEGWQLGEQPPHEYMNWLQNTFGSKLNHILKNGVALWNNETPYLAGSSVQHSGNVWLCKVDNANSEPTDVNANWERSITLATANSYDLGVGQTLQDVTASRSIGVNYTNNTGKPIMVSATIVGDGVGTTKISGSVDGIRASESWASYTASGPATGSSVEFIVPNGATYKIYDYSSTLSSLLDNWAELR